MGGGGCALFPAGSWVRIKHKVAWAEAYLHTNWHLSPSSRLATTDIGQKLGEFRNVWITFSKIRANSANAVQL